MKKGIIGHAYQLASFVVIAALLLAILPHFDWDIFKLITWCLDKIWTAIVKLAEYFTNSPIFKNIFG